jgi:hypothetical protein
LIRDVFIPWIRFGVLEPKEGKEAKGRAHFFKERLLLVRRRSFLEDWRWGLMHEDCYGGGASFVYQHQGDLGLSFIHYFLESFQLGGGRTICSGQFPSLV